jgi:hypothetical protein
MKLTIRLLGAIAVTAAFLMGATPAPKPAERVITPFECMAPGMPTNQDLNMVWKMVDVQIRQIASPGREEQTEPVLLNTYVNGAAKIVIVFHNGNPIYFDPANADDAVVPYINTQWIDENGQLRAKAEGACAWRRITRGDKS